MTKLHYLITFALDIFNDVLYFKLNLESKTELKHSVDMKRPKISKLNELSPQPSMGKKTKKSKPSNIVTQYAKKFKKSRFVLNGSPSTENDNSRSYSDNSRSYNDNSRILNETELSSGASVTNESSSQFSENGISIQASSSSIQADSSAIQANTSSIQANTSSIQANTSSIQANTSSIQANTSSNQADSSAVQANSSSLLANFSSRQSNSTSTLAISPETVIAKLHKKIDKLQQSKGLLKLQLEQNRKLRNDAIVLLNKCDGNNFLLIIFNNYNYLSLFNYKKKHCSGVINHLANKI